MSGVERTEEPAPFIVGPERLTAAATVSQNEEVVRRITTQLRAVGVALHQSPDFIDPDLLDALERAVDKVAETAQALPQPTSYWDHIAGADAPTFAQVSPVSGSINPIAAPLHYEWVDGDDPHVRGHVRFGRSYEGPPNSVHGGFVAAYLDEVLGLAQSLSGDEGMTGSLEVTYRRPTPLERDLVIEGRVVSCEGRKIHVRGEVLDGETVCAEARGTFITVEWDQGPLAPPV